ncbi:MAG: molybdopterin-dependent oxidoreductase [Pseudomonadota bacterium]
MGKTIPTVCARDCYDTCALLVATDAAGRPVRITGDPADPITRGTVCPRGAADLERLKKNRIQAPHIRTNGRLAPASWDAALDIICERLQAELTAGHPERILCLDYAGNMGLLTTSFPRRLWYALGAAMTDGTICSASGKAGIRLHYGECHGIDPIDLPAHPLQVFWGFNTAVSAPHLWRMALLARKQRGAVIAAVDPVRTPTAAAADIWLRPRPGTDVALAYGLIKAIIGMGAHQKAFIGEWTTGFEALAAAAAPWTPAAVEAHTGVGAPVLQQLAEAYARHRPSATLIGIGLQKNTAGADQARAVSLIPAVLGQHRGFFYSSGDAHGVDTARLSGKSLTAVPAPVVSQVGLSPRVARGDFGVIFVTCMNPALTLPGQALFRKGLARSDVFVTVHDTHWTRTTDFADVVLPALTYLEKDDLVIPWSHSRIRVSRRIAPPATDGWDEVTLMRTLARRLGLSASWLYADPWKAVEDAVAGNIRDGGIQDLLAGKPLYLTRKPLDRYPTASGKIEFVSSHAAALGGSPLPEVVDNGGAGWVMLSSALPAYTHTQFQEIYGSIPAVVTIHPEDAAVLDIEGGDRVRLSNTDGCVAATAVVSDMVQKGVVWTPRQFENGDGAAQNALTSAVPQRIGGGATFNATRVFIQKEA